MNRQTLFAGVCVGAIATLCSAQVEPHRDVQLTVEEGQIRTGVVDLDDPGNPVTPEVRVFSRPLGEGGIDHFTDDPGFNAFSDTFFPGTPIGFDIMDHLRRWDPVEGNFDEIPAETMSMSLGATIIETPTAGESPSFPMPGFFFAAASGTGGMHQHVNFFLTTPQTPGVYLLRLRVVSDGSVAPSEPIYIIFAESVEMSEVEDAEAFVDAMVNGPVVCAGDCDGSGDVNFSDLVSMLGEFGSETTGGCDADGSGTVNFSDLVATLGLFGPCE